MSNLKYWEIKDPGLGYKDYGHKDYMDALRYNIEYLGKWKGEQKMGTIFDKALVGGGLYCKDDDGKFVKVMTVTDIETNDDLRYMNTRIKVEGCVVPDSEAEKVEVKNTDKRRMLSSVTGKSNPDDHVYFMIFNGTDLSVKIGRNLANLYKKINYDSPYRVTVYNSVEAIWAKSYHTWHDLECSFMYDVSGALNAWFSTISITNNILRMLREAKRVVSFNCIESPKELDLQRAMMRNILNSMYGIAKADNTPMTVSANIDKVIFDDPATVILWKDGTKTVVHAQDGEPYDKEKGFAMAVCKKVFGNERDYYHVFKRWFRKGEDRSIKRLADKLGNKRSDTSSKLPSIF